MQINTRQLPALNITTFPNNQVQVTHSIPPASLQAMRDHYAIIVDQLDKAIKDCKEQAQRHEFINQSIKEARKHHTQHCIILARIVRKRNLSIKQAQYITKQNQIITRDMAANGRKVSKQRKKAAIAALYDMDYKQARICKMLGYSAPYVSKEIKKHRNKKQQILRLLAPV